MERMSTLECVHCYSGIQSSIRAGLLGGALLGEDRESNKLWQPHCSEVELCSGGAGELNRKTKSINPVVSPSLYLGLKTKAYTDRKLG